MEIVVDDGNRRVEVWLARGERDDERVRESLKPLFAEYKSKKYLVATYNSGGGDLFLNTQNLLLHNKERIVKNIPTTN